jgi:hypothetical protein
VLSVPFDLRWRFAFDHPLTLSLVKLLRAAIETHYRRLAREAGLSSPKSGSVTVIQRFGSDLRHEMRSGIPSALAGRDRIHSLLTLATIRGSPRARRRLRRPGVGRPRACSR